MIFFFFFSSRRRHTRCLSDWSSDVCSSDLNNVLIHGKLKTPWINTLLVGLIAAAFAEIGRASCRERVDISVVDETLKQKHKVERAGNKNTVVYRRSIAYMQSEKIKQEVSVT